MKAKTKVQVRTPAGLVDAPSYYQWKQGISGMDFVFTLHIAAGHPKGFVAPLAISELETGFDTKATIRHPKTGAQMTSANIQGLKSNEVAGIARAALHNLIHKRIGAGRFLQAMLGAQMQINKVQPAPEKTEAALEQFSINGEGTETFRNTEALDKLRGLGTPGTATITGTATPEQVALLEQMFGTCEVCGGSKVVSTTDKDHDGNNIEITCPACIPKAIQLTETKVGDIPRHAPELTEADLPLLRHQRDQLQLLADQHGTMTGDTTEQDYEVLTEEIEELDQHIANLECKPC